MAEQLKKTFPRRKFIKAAAGASLAGAGAWVGLSQSWTPRFVRERISEIGVDVWKPTATPKPADWKDSNITASWLGHASVETTNRYAAVNLETKRAALAKAGTVGKIGPAVAAWRKDASILHWLEAL